MAGLPHPPHRSRGMKYREMAQGRTVNKMFICVYTIGRSRSPRMMGLTSEVTKRGGVNRYSRRFAVKSRHSMGSLAGVPVVFLDGAMVAGCRTANSCHESQQAIHNRTEQHRARKLQCTTTPRPETARTVHQTREPRSRARQWLVANLGC